MCLNLWRCRIKLEFYSHNQGVLTLLIKRYFCYEALAKRTENKLWHLFFTISISSFYSFWLWEEKGDWNGWRKRSQAVPDIWKRTTALLGGRVSRRQHFCLDEYSWLHKCMTVLDCMILERLIGRFYLLMSVRLM